MSLSLQDMSQPASPESTPSTAASAVAISAIYMHDISEHFTGGVPRLPRWQPAHATGGCRPRTSKQWPAGLLRPASASVLMAQLAWSLTAHAGKLPGIVRGSRADPVELKIRTL